MRLKPTKFAVLRDRFDWEMAPGTNLSIDAEGALVLVSIPRFDEGAMQLGRSGRPAGLAITADGRRYCTDPDGHTLTFADGACDVKRTLGEPDDCPGVLHTPRGIAVDEDRLYVADEGRDQVLMLDAHTLEARHAWDLAGPTDVAIGLEGAVYAVNPAGLHRLGGLDEARLVAAAAGAWFVAIDEEGVIHVSSSNEVLRIAADGTSLPPLITPVEPGAIATRNGRIFLADRRRGTLAVFDRGDAVRQPGWLEIPGWSAPVSAMVAGNGALYLSSRPCSLHVLPHAGRAPHGQVVAGPFDAGLGETWERLAVDAVIPRSAALRVDVHLRQDVPDEADWIRVPGQHTLLPPPSELPDEDVAAIRRTATLHPDWNDADIAKEAKVDEDEVRRARRGRWLWVRLQLFAGDQGATPVVRNAVARTRATPWSELLPAIYQRHHEDGSFFDRWLALLKSEHDDQQDRIDRAARDYDPRSATDLDRLARWVATSLPSGAEPAELRARLEQATAHHAERGTPHGIRAAVDRHLGARATVIEAHTQRAIWTLGERSRLGLDTGLAAGAPDGAIVPDEASEVVVGSTVVGEAGPLRDDQMGAPLFDPTAHLFTVLVAASEVCEPGSRELLEAVVRSQTPAHTDVHICAVEPGLRIGVQARVGVDSIIGRMEPFSLNQTSLGESALAPRDEHPRVGQTTRIQRATRRAP